MKKYQNNLKDKLTDFFKFNNRKKIKKIFKFLGVKFFLYNILYFFLSTIVKSKSYFLKGIFFDVQKKQSDITIIKNKFDEKFILFTNDKIISKEMFVKEEFDLNKFEKALDFLNKKKKIENLYDIGANLGIICIPAVKRGLVKKAFAVEPEPKNFQLLKTNIVLNNLEEKILAYNCALSRTDDELVDMELATDNAGDHRIKNEIRFNIHDEEKRKIIQVKTKKFDTLFKNINSEKDLIWMDTQGHEADILMGAENLIISKTPIVIEFWPYALKRNNMWETMIKLLKKFDYIVDLSRNNLEAQEANEKNLNNLVHGWHEEKKNKHSLFTDLLLLKK